MNEIKKLNIGFNFITKGYNLPCDYIIHTVGPIIKNEVHEYQKKELEMCYLNALKTAKENGIRSIAFPCISTGEYNFPKSLASKIAVNSVRKYLSKFGDDFDLVVFVTYNENDYDYYVEVLNKPIYEK